MRSTETSELPSRQSCRARCARIVTTIPRCACDSFFLRVSLFCIVFKVRFARFAVSRRRARVEYQNEKRMSSTFFHFFFIKMRNINASVRCIPHVPKSFVFWPGFSPESRKFRSAPVSAFRDPCTRLTSPCASPGSAGAGIQYLRYNSAS